MPFSSLLKLPGAPQARPLGTRSDDSPVTAERNAHWSRACQDFLAAVPDEMRDNVAHSLRTLHTGGVGLRRWVARIATGESRLPANIPLELIGVYLADSEAIPLHDCEDCGLAVPVRPHPLRGLEGEPDQVYFRCCPACGGRTGWYLFCSRQVEDNSVSHGLRRQRPR